jgi:hypothetical protein
VQLNQLTDPDAGVEHHQEQRPIAAADRGIVAQSEQAAYIILREGLNDPLRQFDLLDLGEGGTVYVAHGLQPAKEERDLAMIAVPRFRREMGEAAKVAVEVNGSDLANRAGEAFLTSYV